MSQAQLNRFSVISKVIDGHMTIADATKTCLSQGTVP